MFRKLLIANRGEIAVRVIRACRELGVAPVAVYSEADARALHVLEADEAVCIGPAPAVESYLNIRAIIDAARATGTEAVHPGYGFLSENPEFAEACIAAGLVWVGPPPAAMRAMASKIEAKRLAAEHGVPLLPGYQGDAQDDTTLIAEAERTGYPLLIKASAGGGGRGMRVVERPEDFTEALESARREARAAFGDDRVLLERYITRPRHIEIQVFGDTHGNVVHLGERECSVQRRHQKVIEESPSPVLTPELREQMGEAAVRLARAIGYTGAGTVEFIATESEVLSPKSEVGGTPRLSFAFLEMNTRLQVEHGVTELVTGLDLVQLQMRVAAGEPLPFTQADVRQRGHAIQCRIYAEDPANGYLPSSGRLTSFHTPNGKGVRNDVGVAEWDEVSTYYDPMLAKLLVHGEGRTAAIARAVNALDDYQVEGVATNLPLLRAAVRHPEFAAGHTYTTFLEEHILPTLQAEAHRTLSEEMLLGAAAYDLLLPEWADAEPWSAGPWRQAGAEISLTYQYLGATYTVVASRLTNGEWGLEIGDQLYRIRTEWVRRPGWVQRVSRGLIVRAGTAVHAYTVWEYDGEIQLEHKGQSVKLTRSEPPSIAASGHAGPGGGGARALTAPLAGVVVKVSVAEGDQVAARQPLVILEAMKMEHTISAPSSGVVSRLHRAAGDRVQAGDVLVEMEPE